LATDAQRDFSAVISPTFFLKDKTMPNRRKSTATKSLQGTARSDREPKVDYSARLTEPPPAPANLAKNAIPHWDRIAAATVGIGTLTNADLSLLRLLADTLAVESEARAALSRDGMTTQAGSGGTKKHPAAGIAETARIQALAILREFGLTPRARQSVDRAPASAGNPFFRDGGDSRWAEFATSQGSPVGDYATDPDLEKPASSRRGRLQ
jgi:P27 family predicted phage terminase small subunit